MVHYRSLSLTIADYRSLSQRSAAKRSAAQRSAAVVEMPFNPAIPQMSIVGVYGVYRGTKYWSRGRFWSPTNADLASPIN